MPGGLLFNFISQNRKKDFLSFLSGFGLSEFADDILDSYDDIAGAKLTKQALYNWYVGKGKVTKENVNDIFSKIEKKIAGYAADVDAKAPAADPAAMPNAAPLDVSPRYAAEDAIFHDFLNYLKAVAENPDQERRLFNVFISFLKGLRDQFETKEVLGKDPIHGGCGLKTDKAGEVFAKFQSTVADLTKHEFDPNYATDWFRDHYDSIMINNPVKGEVEELAIDSHREKAEGEHRLIPSVPDHDYNMPLMEHINLHFKEVNAEQELKAPAIQKEIAAPAAPKAIPPVASKPKAQPAPLPTRTLVRPAEAKTTQEMVSVEKKPIVAPMVSDDLRARVIPAQIKQMIDMDAASAKAEQEAIQSISKPKKQGLFSRMFAKKPAVAKPSAPLSQPTINAIPTVDGRPQVTDVIFTPKLVTPIDELQSLTLADFRRLAKDPFTAIKKIEDKLNLLAQESFKKKAEGIEALKKSGLYRDYSAIMSESVMQGISSAEVIQKQKTLSEDEYKALMQLNKQLRS